MSRRETVVKSYEVPAEGTLTLKTRGFGVTRVRGGARALEVAVTGSDPERAWKGVEVSPKRKGAEIDASGPRSSDDHMELSIRVPSGYRVEVEGSGGNVSIDGVDGGARGRVKGGSLHLHRVAGGVEGRTSGGSVIAVGCSGRAELRTSGGSITVTAAAGDVDARTSGGFISVVRVEGRVSARASAGCVRVEEVAGGVEAVAEAGTVSVRTPRALGGTYSLKSSAGSVVLELPAGTGAALDAESRGGGVFLGLSADHGEAPVEAVRAPIAGGGPEVRLRTQSGDVFIVEI